MLIETLDIRVGQRKGGKLAPTGTRPVIALCDETWAIHPSGHHDDTLDPLFSLTHRLTGCEAMRGTWDYVLATVHELRQRPLNWAFTDPAEAKALTAEFRDAQRCARQAIGGIWPQDVRS